MHRIILFVLCIFVALPRADAAELIWSDIEVRGYKTVNFSMSVDEVAALPNYKCEQVDHFIGTADAGQCKGIDTIFGMRSSVFVLFRKGLVSYIGVTASDTKPVNLVEAFRKVLGQPNVYTAPSFLGNPLQVSYWLSRSGTSIEVTVNPSKPNGGPDVHAGMSFYSQAVSFHDRNTTAAMVKKAEEREMRDLGKDF